MANTVSDVASGEVADQVEPGQLHKDIKDMPLCCECSKPVYAMGE